MSKSILPSLLNEDLIQRALQNLHQLNDTKVLKLKSCNFKHTPANGDNFCSEIYQVEVQYELNDNNEHKSFIVKLTVPSEDSESGTNEEIMFKTVLPEMESVLIEISGINCYNKFNAKCLISEYKPVEFYVFENLNSLGYYCADRSKGLNFEHAKILMKKIAKFHAASMMFNKKYPEIVTSRLGSHFENGEDEMPEPFTKGCLEYVSNIIKCWPSYESIADKISSVIPKFNRLTFEAFNSKNSKFNVINHGDLWVNNFLYKHNKESGEPLDVLFVDFQLSFWGSCGCDINWFLNSSLELDVLKNKRQELIEIYYETLNQTLKLMNYCQNEIPTLEDVIFEVKRCEFIGFYIALCEFPVIALGKSHSEGLDSRIFKQPEKIKQLRKLLYNNPRVKETLKYSLKYFEKINLFKF